LIPVGVAEKASAPVLGLRYKKGESGYYNFNATKFSYYF